MNRLRLRPLLLATIACLGLSGCLAALVLGSIPKDISRQPRFQEVVGHEVRTRKALYLYKPEYSSTHPDLRDFYQFHASRDEGARGSPILVVPEG